MDALQRLWQQAVAAHASKPALTYQSDGSVTTFAKLHEAVEALASELRAAGATAGRAVAYAVDEQAPAKAVVCQLACLTAGAVYCPTDDPAATRAALAPACRVDADGVERLADAPVAWLPDALYALATSGTGAGGRKAVVGSAAATLHRLRWEWDTFAGGAALLRTPAVFVDSVAEVLGALLRGDGLLVPSGADALRCARDLGAAKVTLTPSLLAAWLRADPQLPASLPAVARWHCSGEPLPRRLRERFLARCLASQTLVNIYGCTETAADCAFAIETAPGRCACGGLRALPGATVAVDGGEIVVRGKTLALGYAARGGLVRPSFDPPDLGAAGPGPRFEAASGVLAFRTGDAGTACATCGAVICGGRLDDVVNVHGVRVSCNDVEERLGAGVAVVVRDGRLVACCEDVEDARRRAATIPARYRPAAFCEASPLPRGPTGKVDRAALRRLAPNHASPAPAAAVPRPTTATTAVLDAFSAVLGRPVAGDTSFAALGGTSLQAVEAAWRLGVAPDDVLSLSIGELAPRVDASSPRAPAPPADENGLAPPPPKRARTTTLRRAWSLQLKACVDAAVALFDDGRKGLVASHGRDLVCFDTRSGAALWTAGVALGESLAGEADAAIEAPCIVVDCMAFVGGYDGRVYAVAVADGTLRWTSAPCAGPIKGAATALDATTLVVGSHGGFVRAMALADGSVRRTSEHLGGAVFAAPTLAGAVLVVATTAGVVHGLQAATLAPLWRKAGAPVFAQPVVHEDAVIYGDVSGAVHAVSYIDGSGLWSIVGSAAPVYAPVAVVGANVCVADDRGGLVFRDATSGALRQRRSVPGAKFFKAPVLVSDTLVAVSTDGRVFVVSATDGAPVAECDLGAKAFSAPVVVGSRVFVGARDDRLHAVDML
jgi:acyl-coenzyme A synthetase/AMP-(fatty) acid ligase/outer membrane protein assembly factor BamB